MRFPSIMGLVAICLGLASLVFRAHSVDPFRGFASGQQVREAKGFRIYYAPWQNLEQIDAQAIATSRCNHLDLAAYSLTDWKVAEAIVQIAQSGRPVRIYRDREQYEEELRRGNKVLEMLRRPNISIKVKQSAVLMHQKAWSDGCLLREGSANFSPSSEKQQDNTLAITDDPQSVKQFEQVFQAMWSRADNIVVQ